jgi:hypothetical protein
MSNINNIISDRTTNTFKIVDHNGDDVLEVDANNDLKIGRGAHKQTLCSNTGVPNMGGASPINHDKIIMNDTLTEHPIIVYLPALLSDFPDPVKNLLVKINSSGNIQPIAYGDLDNTGVVGTTDEVVMANGLIRVQVGGVCSFTPSAGQTILSGQKFERSNSGVPILFGTIMMANGVGTCGVALTSGTGAADGSVKVLGLWTKNEHF